MIGSEEDPENTESLQAKVVELRRENAALKEHLEMKEQELAESNAVIREMKVDLADAQECYVTLTPRASKLEDSRASTLADLQDAQEEVIRLHAKVKKLESERSQLHVRDVPSTEVMKGGQEADLHELERSIAILSQTNDESLQSLHDAKQTIKAKEAELVAAVREAGILQARVIQLDEAADAKLITTEAEVLMPTEGLLVDELQALVAKLNQDNADLSKAHQNAKKDLKSKENKLSSAEASQELAQAEVAKLQEKSERLHARVKQAERAKAGAQRVHDEAGAGVEVIESLSRQVSELEMDVKALQVQEGPEHRWGQRLREHSRGGKAHEGVHEGPRGG